MRLHPAFLLLFFALVPGCSEQEVGKIEKVTGKAWDRARGATSQMGDELGIDLEFPGKPDEMGLLRRVQQRLKWDQQLSGASIKVQIVQEEVVLSGNVRDESQRHRAVQLAESTDGVRKVKDVLQIVVQ